MTAKHLLSFCFLIRLLPAPSSSKLLQLIFFQAGKREAFRRNQQISQQRCQSHMPSCTNSVLSPAVFIVGACQLLQLRCSHTHETCTSILSDPQCSTYNRLLQGSLLSCISMELSKKMAFLRKSKVIKLQQGEFHKSTATFQSQTTQNEGRSAAVPSQ